VTDRVAILGKIEHNPWHRLRHLHLRADDLVARPSDDDLASLAREGMLGAAAAKLYTKVRAGEGDAALAKARSNACSSNIRGGLLREPEAAAHHCQRHP
jgi:hypothetical protein